MKQLRFILLIATVAFFGADALAQKKKKEKEEDPLESRVFMVDIEEVRNGKKMKPKQDKMTFKYEKVSCKYLKEKTGFNNVAYVIMKDSTFINIDDNEERLTHFMGEALDEKGQELTWKGSVSDNSVSAEVSLSKNGVLKKQFIITGQQKN